MTLPNTATTADDFEGAPPPQSFFSPSNHPNALVLFVPKEFIANKEFTFGIKDCTVSAVWIIQGEGAGCEWQAAEVAGVKMCSQLASRIGGKVLGRITKEAGTGNRPFVISSATTDDKAIASTWLNAGNNRSKVERAQRAAQDAASKPVEASWASHDRPVPTTTGMPSPPPVTRHDEPPF